PALGDDDVLAALGAPEVLHHHRVALQLLQQREVAAAPRLDAREVPRPRTFARPPSVHSGSLPPRRDMPVDNTIYDLQGDRWWGDEVFLAAIRTALNPGRLRYISGVLSARGIDPRGTK